MLYQAKNVSSAVEMAEEMKRQGTHEWFRGQTHNWTLQSSLNRNRSKFEKSVERIKAFIGWVSITPGLEHLATDVDSTIAVAQHYGFPTHFIDFTTEPYVAGYFASENVSATDPQDFDFESEKRRFFSSEPASDKVGCILCLNREDLLRTWKSVAAVRPVAKASEPEFLVTAVPDLWRLEAQHGVFFYCPIERFEQVVYDFDRIIFPHSGQIAWPAKDLIYPERKSSLEILLDQYFLLEQIHEFNEYQKETGFDKLMKEKVHFSSKRPSMAPVHPSWKETSIASYLSPSPSSFFTSISASTWTVDFHNFTSAQDASESVREQVLVKLKEHKNVRNELIHWKSDDPAFDAAAILVWDGLRQLPCIEDDIAIAIGNCAGLSYTARKFNLDSLSASKAYYGTDVVEVEFCGVEKGFSRAYISKQHLLKAFRDDMQEFLNADEQAWLSGDPGYILLKILNPKRMFPFDRFEKLFLQEVVPSQAVWRKKAIIYSPARIEVFGLP